MISFLCAVQVTLASMGDGEFGLILADRPMVLPGAEYIPQIDSHVELRAYYVARSHAKSFGCVICRCYFFRNPQSWGWGSDDLLKIDLENVPWGHVTCIAERGRGDC